MLKLKSLLTEAPAGEVGGSQDMANKVTSKPLAQSVSMLQKLASDPDTKDILEIKFKSLISCSVFPP